MNRLALAESDNAAPSPTRIGDKEGRVALVFDDLFSTAQVDNFAKILASLPYARGNSFDTDLKYCIDTERFRAAPFLFGTTERLIAQYGGNMVPGPLPALSHIYCATLGPGGQTVIHQDQPCAHCLTFLYYGNIAWRGSWGGETLFFDSDDGDTVGAVLPRRGRLALFNSNIWHRAGIPQRDCPAMRYTASVFYYCDAHRAPAIVPGASPSVPALA